MLRLLMSFLGVRFALQKDEIINNVVRNTVLWVEIRIEGTGELQRRVGDLVLSN